MKKDKVMKKSTFVKGAFVTTLGIVISKILGILYVIPFHAVIGEQGGALYGYAYTIYLLFMSLSSAGIPLAISKVVSEYHALGYYNAKKRAFILGKKLAMVMGMLCFILIMIFAPVLARWVLGDLTGGNTIESVTLVIRIIASAILVVPVLSVYRGYFEGHRFMNAPSISQVIEQIVRVLIIVIGSYLVLDIFKMSLTTSVGVALFGATVGALISYFYLVFKLNGNKRKFNEKIRSVNEPIISNKVIFKKIIIYAIPFIMIDIFKSLYNYVDMVTVVKALVNVDFSVQDAEVIMSMLSTWGSKFNMIVLSVSTGVIVSLIPNLTQSVVNKDKKDMNIKINQTLSMLFFLMIPMSIGISFLAEPIWTVFYGSSKYGPSILGFYIFVGLIIGLFTAMVSVVQILKDYKSVFISLLAGIVIKIILNVNLINTFYSLGLPAYYGVITASLIGYLVSFVICIVVLASKFKINFEESAKNFIDILCASLFMMIVLFVMSLVIPKSLDGRFINIFTILLYSVVGAVVYFVFLIRTKTINNIFGGKIDKFIKKMVR